MIYYLNNGYRKLIKTYAGLPEGAGIYLLPDGSKRFYNCAPGQPPQDMPDYEALLEEEEKRERIKQIGLHVIETDTT